MRTTDPIHKSPLWSLIHDYYQDQGILAWSEDIPFQATNHSGMVAHAARCIQGFATPHPTVHWHELGAGHGLFAYRLAQHLTDDVFHGQVSDASSSNVAFWQHHPSWQQYPTISHLQQAFSPLIQPNGPTVYIANYLFDSLPFRAFSYDTQWHEHQLELTLPYKHLQKNKQHLNRIQCSYPKQPLTVSSLSPRWQRVFQHLPQSGRFSVPTPLIDWLDQLYLQANPVMILGSDKAFCQQAHQRYDAQFNCHWEGCFSSVINLEWVKHYIEINQLGHCWLINHDHHHFNVQSFVILMHQSPNQALFRAIEQWQEQPSYFFMKDKDTLAFTQKLNWSECLYYLEKHHYDTWIYDWVYRSWHEQLRHHDDALKLLNNIHQQCYALPGQTTLLRLADDYRSLQQMTLAKECLSTYQTINGCNFYYLRESGRWHHQAGDHSLAQRLWQMAYDQGNLQTSFEDWAELLIKDLT